MMAWLRNLIEFSQENWDIALTARRQDKLLKITKEIGSNNTICPANVADKLEVEQAFNKCLKYIFEHTLRNVFKAYM